MRMLIFALLLIGGSATAQTRQVIPGDLQLTVTVENADVTPYRQEMILLTIHGVYRRHITLEKLEQPDLSGFNWMQLGQDHWYETQLDGKTVKNFRRRMALYPDRAGTLDIGPFIHHLTLTDERDDWFAHDIQSEPLTIEVAPQPPVKNWWFPARRLEVSDQWSNAPDQLLPGEGVLRVIRITAIGVSPDMIPPMPQLYSPSAMIFPHPEKRLVELSPQGPVSVAFWRWTIRPTNGRSAILEPIEFEYFDTTTRQMHQVTITAQRVAMDQSALPDPAPPPAEVQLHSAALAGTGLLALITGLAAMFAGRRFDRRALRRWWVFEADRRRLRRASRQGDTAALRQAAVALMRGGPGSDECERLLDGLDRAVFGPDPATPDHRSFAHRFLAAHRRTRLG